MIELHDISVLLNHAEVDCWNFQERHAELLRQGLPGVRVRICGDEGAFAASLDQADACLVWRFRQEWFASAPRLKLLSTPAAGRDYFRVTPPLGVQLMYGQFHGQLIGETVVGMLLGMSRGLCAGITEFAEAAWPRRELCAVMRPLRGCHVVILGLGNVGGWIGRLLKPFGVRISGMRRNMSRPAPDWFTEEDRLFTAEQLNDVLPTADHVVLALPGTADTDNMLNGQRINLLKREATIVNVGRGNSIEGMSLYSALASERLAGAFLDVFPEEPLPVESMLRRCPRLWRLPHASAISPNYLDLYVMDLLRQLKGAAPQIV